jgi:hypothetical protein
LQRFFLRVIIRKFLVKGRKEIIKKIENKNDFFSRIFHFLYLKIIQTNSWDYQRRNSRILLQIDNGTTSENRNDLRKKYSDASIQSQYHLHPFYHRSESLINMRTSNIHNNNSNQTQCPKKFSICDFNYKQPNNFPYSNDQQNLQITSKQPRDYSKRLLFNHNKHSLTIQTQNSHYKTNKRAKNKQKPIFICNPIRSSSSTTTTSNVTRSTINTTGSESSILIDQINLLKPITNNKKKSKFFFRK